jgi:uncharacterized protein (TIGR03437 family)
MILRKNRFLFSAAAGVMFGWAVAQGQTADTSGNGLLKGVYAFRNVAVQNEDPTTNNPTQVTATYGTITFDGNGNYTISGMQVDNTVSSGAPQTFSVTATYAIGANGAGYIASPLYPTDPLSNEYGAVAQGVFVGSATEAGSEGFILNDIFIALPFSSSAANGGFTATYQAGLIDFQNGGSASIQNALFNLSPNGSGGLGTISLTGQASNQTASTVIQSVSGATYSFTGGSATLTIPTPSGISAANSLFTGTKTLYQSTDGNFVLGWTSTGYDIFFGVKGLTSSATNSISQGLYFTAGLEDFAEAWGTDSYYGSEYNTGDANGDSIVHQRLNAPGIYGSFAEDFGTDDNIILNSSPNGSAGDNSFEYSYMFGDSGLAYVAVGTGGYYSLVVGLHAANFSGSGVYINPVMVYNAASYQPITAALTPGELITLFGTGLASSTTAVQGGQSVPMTLGGVSATINSIPAPVFAVSSGQVSIIVPYELDQNTTSPYANIQLTNNNVQSNVVQMFFQDSAPGSFSQTQNGLGFAAARHAADGSLITQANPVQPGEYISLYLTGLGTVTPPITDGAVASSTTLTNSDEWTNNNLQVLFNDYGPLGTTGNSATIQFAGLTPGLAALYQINVQVPTTGLAAGDDVEVELFTDTADVNQIYVPYGSGAPPPLIRSAAKHAIVASRTAHAAAHRSSVRRPVTRTMGRNANVVPACDAAQTRATGRHCSR